MTRCSAPTNFTTMQVSRAFLLLHAAPPVARVELIEEIRAQIPPPADTLPVQDVEELVGDERLTSEVLGFVGTAGEVGHLAPCLKTLRKTQAISDLSV